MKRIVYNPYLPNYEYVPDGEPHIFDGRLYIYGSHDKFNGHNFCVNDYVTWSTPIDDLSLWRFEGYIFKKKDDLLTKGRKVLFAPDVCQGPNGRYYLYYGPAMGITTKSWNIHCAVSDKPNGPFKFLGRVNLDKWKKEYLPFDPAVFVENGHVYLYYGSASFYPLLDVRSSSIKGGAVVELDPTDMLTVINGPYLTVPTFKNDKNKEYGEHSFFEASSLRKIKDKYYFIYSSKLGHELCYAIGDKPIGPFKKGGTLVSNGDIGLNGHINPKSACDFTGNTHGSIVEIQGRYYVFYHRQTNKCQFSRQGVAEEIFINEDGSINQVERTSQGLFGEPLPGKGEYPASICSGLKAKNGNRFYGISRLNHFKEPYLTQLGKDREENPNQFIKNFGSGCFVAYKYFDLTNTKTINIEIRGTAKGVLVLNHNDIEIKQNINIDKETKIISFSLDAATEKDCLTFSYFGKGKMDLIKLIFD